MSASYCFFARRNKKCKKLQATSRGVVATKVIFRFPALTLLFIAFAALSVRRVCFWDRREYGQAGSGLDDRRDPRSRCSGGAGSLCAIVPNAQTCRRESGVGGSLLGGVLGTAVAAGKGSNPPRRALLHCRGTRGGLGVASMLGG